MRTDLLRLAADLAQRGEALHVAEFAGATYHCCCAGCRARFLAEPEQFTTAPDTGAPHGE